METPVLSRQLRANAFCNFSKALSGVHFLNISASKIVPIVVCFLRFDFEKRASSRYSRVHCFDISTSKSVRT
jgi:hypothetical protein